MVNHMNPKNHSYLMILTILYIAGCAHNVDTRRDVESSEPFLTSQMAEDSINNEVVNLTDAMRTEDISRRRELGGEIGKRIDVVIQKIDQLLNAKEWKLNYKLALETQRQQAWIVKWHGEHLEFKGPPSSKQAPVLRAMWHDLFRDVNNALAGLKGGKTGADYLRANGALHQTLIAIVYFDPDNSDDFNVYYQRILDILNHVQQSEDIEEEAQRDARESFALFRATFGAYKAINQGTDGRASWREVVESCAQLSQIEPWRDARMQRAVDAVRQCDRWIEHAGGERQAMWVKVKEKLSPKLKDALARRLK